ncbi:MAG: glycosyltransferase family 9 protein, partial [Planctomycetota bacterium]
QVRRPEPCANHIEGQLAGVLRVVERTLLLEDYLGPPRWSRGALDQARGIRSEVPEGQRVLALHGDTGADKMLPDRAWREVLEALCAEDPELTVLLVGKRPLPLDVGPWEAQVVPCYGLPLEVSMALVGLVDGFMGVDSSPLHAADFQGVPSVGVFVSTDPHEFGCICAPHEHVLARDASDAGLPGKIVEAVGRLLGPGGPRGASKARSFQARAFQARALKGRSLKGLGAGQ